jgi:hypothetical protein
MDEVKTVFLKDVLNGYSLSSKVVSYTDLTLQLKEYFEEIPFKGIDTFLNVPVLVDHSQLEVFSRLSEILNSVIKKIVLNYFNDKRIREIYQLDDELGQILFLIKMDNLKFVKLVADIQLMDGCLVTTQGKFSIPFC